MVRAFLALELSGDIREQLRIAQNALRASSARMTFVEPENIHITVKFLGEVDSRTLPGVMDELRTIRFTPFPVHAGDVTVNNPKRPFTVWCTIADGGRGEDLFRSVEDITSSLGFSRETRKFTPHATLARIKDYDPSLMPIITSLKGNEYGECMITGLKLKKSTLTQRGPVYEDLLEVRW